MAERRADPAGWLSAALAFVLAAAWLLVPLRLAGAWDPYEPDNADLARRVAVHAFGARELARAGDPPTLPTLGDLGTGELPFTSMALSFRVFGFHDWSGRLALALWALGGALALYALMARLVHPRAGFFSVVALLGSPLFFLQARTMLGDAVVMASFALAVCGLSLLVADRSARVRALAAPLAAAGLLAGYLSRGLLLGVAAPCLAVGLALLVAGGPARGARAWGVGLTSIAALAAARFAALAAPIAHSLAPPPRGVAMTLFDATPNDSTFDRVVRQLGHGMFPWSILLPIAIAALFTPATSARAGDAAARVGFVKVLLLSAIGVSLAASALLVPVASDLPFVGVAALAGALGLFAHELGGAPSRRLGAAVALLVGLTLWLDLDREPARTLEAFSAPAAVFPSTFAEPARRWIAAVAALFLVGASHALVDAAPPAPRAGLRAALSAWWRELSGAARALGRALYEAHQGNVVFVLVLLEAALVGLAATLFVGQRAGWSTIVGLPSGLVRAGIAAWWVAPLGALAILALPRLAGDVARGSRRALGLSRGGWLVLWSATSGAVLSFSYFPALAEQLSPKAVFERFEERAGEGAELALLGTSPRIGALYASGDVRAFDDVGDAYRWLSGAAEGRRFLVLKARDLPKLNSLWRGAKHRNVPVVDGRSSQNVLVSDRLSEGEHDESPFSALLPAEEPAPQHEFAARWAENFALIGWDLIAPDGKRADKVEPGRRYLLRVYIRVEKPVRGAYKAFLHVDGDGKRYNADHPPLGGRYPLSLWQPGDVVVDETELLLEPNFTPGTYWVYFGFFQDSTRLPVSEGRASENRVILGPLTVR